MTQKVNFKNGNLTIAGIVFLPEGFDENKKYAALVVSHPAGGVKEQTASIYAAKMAEKGFVTLAFDATYQGESTGEPRHLEDPNARVGDISAVVDYLTTLPYVDADKIGAVGICASGGYVTAAVKQDHRIKAMASVSGVDIGEMYHVGWNGNGPDMDIPATLEAIGKQRTAEANGAEALILDWIGKKEDIQIPEMLDGYEYYKTDRAQHCNSSGELRFVDLQALIAFRAYDRVDTLLTQPLLIFAGSEAGTLWSSKLLNEKAASKNKELVVLEGFNHFDLYDKPECVNQIADKMDPFFKNNLKN
ncbi:alpha/beta hydrolase [Chryseobacterium sp.]|uniref:alpha/beta hydrolase n=1 Tax=Chryseobacterium sp. TaxID=1871047 RepID=UPI003340BAB0